MAYKISQVADMLDLPASTIRYYDKEGLLPQVERGRGGQRVFSENDVEMLRTVEMLKQTGMSIKEIHQYSQWLRQGESTIPQRVQMLRERKNSLKEQIKELEHAIAIIDDRCDAYAKALSS